MRRSAEITALILFSLNFLFHVTILIGLTPSGIVWGSRIESESQFYLLESLSLLFNGLFIAVMLSRLSFWPSPLSPKFLRICLWFMAIFFLLNSLGNVLSKNSFEQLVFTPLTLILSVSLFLSLWAESKSKRQRLT